MTKIDIVSGFLGAGKTTLIKKLIAEAYTGEKVVLIENEFGEIGIDGGFLKEAGITITEMNSGCICCSLVGDFTEALGKVLAEYAPDRIVIEPSGVGKLSDVIRAVQKVESDEAKLNAFTTVVDAKKCKMYLKNFGEFFCDQVEHASAVVLSHTASLTEEKLAECVKLLKENNDKAVMVTTDWDKLSGAQLLAAIENRNTLEAELIKLREEEDICPECGHHHHHHHGEDEEEHHHHHHHDEEDGEEHHHRHHHHHHHDEVEEGYEYYCGEQKEEDEEHSHHHHHHHDGEEHEHHHHHDGEHHHHHHADEVFTSFGKETAKKFSVVFIKAALSELENEEKFGVILRAKGIVEGENGEWIHFDYVPGEPDVRTGAAGITGRLCVIGSQIKEDALAALFGI